jgi:hypothetical protein
MDLAVTRLVAGAAADVMPCILQEAGDFTGNHAAGANDEERGHGISCRFEGAAGAAPGFESMVTATGGTRNG